MRLTTWVAAAIASLGSAACARATSESPGRGAASPATLALVVTPVRASSPEVRRVEVQARLSAWPTSAAARPCVRSPVTYAGRTGIADRVENLQLRDAAGPVSVAVHDDAVNPGGYPWYRHWCAARALRGAVTLGYAMRANDGPVTPGPQFDFYSHAGGVSFGGMAVFVLPELADTLRLSVRWDLRDLPKGSIAANTFGEGDVTRTGPPELLAQAYYMAGPLGRFVPPDAAGSFAGYWLGTPAFDARRELQWTWRMNRYLQQFWGDSAGAPYRIFIRALTGTGGGTALQRSFMYGVPPGAGDSTTTASRNTLAHEMGHMFLGTIEEGGGAGATWFNEGLNTFYTRLLILRSGYAPVSDYLDDINATARNYYGNRYRLLSADSLSRLGFSAGIGSGSAQNVPYTRGSLWWATMDDRIRVASGGRRRLDDVILPLVRRWRSGASSTVQSVVDALVAEIGEEAREEFARVIVRGELVEPSSGAFGPCVARDAAAESPTAGDPPVFKWRRVHGVPDEACRQW